MWFWSLVPLLPRIWFHTFSICHPLRLTATALVALLWLPAARGAENVALKNWFDDPFFQVGDDISRCPVPLGPFLSEAEMRGEAHSRVERGTSCWMAGQCAQPNAYLYDKQIADAVRARAGAMKNASIWITVKRRFVWAEGCVTDAEQADELAALLKAVPDVERVFVNVLVGASGKPPYPVRPAQRNGR